MKLLTNPIRQKLIDNFKRNQKASGQLNLKPVVKFFGGSSATWLITELDPENQTFFGLCDPGLGFPELGSVSVRELFEVRFPPFGLPVERDRHFKASKSLSEYAKEAHQKRFIIS